MSDARRWTFCVLLFVLTSACSSASQFTGAPISADEAATTSVPSTTASATAPTGDDQSATTDTTPPVTEGPTSTVEVEPDRLAGTYLPMVTATFPHDPTAYTQGLEIFDSMLIESTGLNGESERRVIDIASGAVLRSVSLSDDQFGEGLTVVGDELIQLTWRNGVYFRADATTLEQTGSGTYEGEGWGLCFDGAELIMSNGSDRLAFRDPVTFEVVREVAVTRSDGTPVERLNELECVGDQVVANIYTSDEIVVIDPISGAVDASIDASSLRPDGAPRDDADYALNGIAYDAASRTFFITGKLWPVIYEVSLSPS